MEKCQNFGDYNIEMLQSVVSKVAWDGSLVDVGDEPSDSDNYTNYSSDDWGSGKILYRGMF